MLVNIKRLLELLQHENPNVRNQSIKALKTFYEGSSGIISHIIRAIDKYPGDSLSLVARISSFIPNDDEPSSYINFYIANNGIVMPSFMDEKADYNAKTIIQSVFPNRKIIDINGIDILMGGGNVHCITQQQPQSKKL